MSLEQQLPQSPPPEVERAIAVAADAYDQLDASGQRIHFGLELGERTVAVELRDLSGNQLSELSPSEALALAEGASPA